MIFYMSVLLSLIYNDVFITEHNIKLTIPCGYQIALNRDQAPLLYIGGNLEQEDYPRVNLIKSMGLKDEMYQAKHDLVESLKTQLNNYTVLSAVNNFTLEGKEAFKLVGSYVLNEKELVNVQYYFDLNNSLYIMTGTTLKKNLKKEMKFFDDIYTSIKKIKSF